MNRLNERITFHMIELVNDEHPVTGHFRLERVTGDLAYATMLFVVEDQTGRCWPMATIACLHAND